MMIQDEIFKNFEGDNWFQRNKEVILHSGEDRITSLIKQLKLPGSSFAEVGCCNGYRLERLRKEYCPLGTLVGFDISKEAIQDGLSRYPQLNLWVRALNESYTEEKFDITICNFVLHWIDRKNLLSSIMAIDKLVKDGGYLIIGDFYPDFNKKRRYHHVKEKKLYTYKQDYPNIFVSLGSYREIFRSTFNHDMHGDGVEYTESDKRAVCSVLKKMENEDFYREV